MKAILTTLLALVCTFTLSTQSLSAKRSQVPTKRELMEDYLKGKKHGDYVPTVFFSHFPAKVGQDAVYYHIRHLARTGIDMLKVQFEQQQPKMKMEKPEDWQKIQPLPRDFYNPTVEVVKEIFNIVGHETMVLPTVYSPFQVLRMQIGIPSVIRWAKRDPQQLLRVLRIYTDGLLNYVRDCKALGIDGFFMPTQGGENIYKEVPDFFETFIRPFDMEVMTECTTGTHYNILHICDWEGPYDDLDAFIDYPGQIVNAPNVVGGKPFTPTDAERMFKRAALGGLERKGLIRNGTPEQVTEKVKELLKNNRGRYILGAECTIDGRTPIENIRAAVRTAHGK